MPSRTHRSRAVALLALVLALLAPGLARAADTIVVGLRPGALAATALDAADAVQVGAVPRLRAVVVHVAPGRRSAALRALRRSRAVRYAEPLRRLQALADPLPDPGRVQQWGLDAIGADLAWTVTRGAGVVVAVVDTGVAPAPDLEGRLLPGWNVLARSDDAMDDNGHGTHVAGTVAEVAGNGLAESGVAPEASILPVKVLDSTGSGSDADVAAGIVWAADHAARIVNLSLGGSEPSTVLADGVAYARGKGVLIVAAAGNDGGAVGVPARLAGVLAVGAVDASRVRAPFSAGGRALDLVAPGVGILQQTLDGAGGYADRSWSGTSMATPHVAGVAALVLAAGRAKTAAGVTRLLTRTALDLGVAGRDPAYGAGLVRADAAVGQAVP
ncbi:MAG TPA: S8 family serine peptidase [Gaiellales bacterium]|jgi:subtilisin family serine protease|nr:S8 family serine peptidase [Gaiellales bacterium]